MIGENKWINKCSCEQKKTMELNTDTKIEQRHFGILYMCTASSSVSRWYLSHSYWNGIIDKSSLCTCIEDNSRMATFAHCSKYSISGKKTT